MTGLDGRTYVWHLLTEMSCDDAHEQPAPVLPNDKQLGDAIASHVAMIASYIREMQVSQEREGQLAANVGAAVMLALTQLDKTV